MNEVMYINSLYQINHNSPDAHYVNIFKFIFKPCPMELKSEFIITPSWLENMEKSKVFEDSLFTIGNLLEWPRYHIYFKYISIYIS